MICIATEYVVKNKLELTVYLTQKSDGHAKIRWPRQSAMVCCRYGRQNPRVTEEHCS